MPTPESPPQSLPLTSSHWGTYRVETRARKVVALHGFEQDGDVSAIGSGIIDVLDGPSRIQTPCVRQSWLEEGPAANRTGRGVEPFIAVSWEIATTLVATELERVRLQYGNQAIYAGSYGWASAGRFHHAQSQVHRFLNCIGGYTRSVNSYSFAAAEVVVPHVLGDFIPYLASTTSWVSIIEHTQLLVAFGGIPTKNGQINSGGVGRHIQRESVRNAHQAGVQFCHISPIKADMDEVAESQWIALRPSTDTALLLALAHTLYDEQLFDDDFIRMYTVGFESFTDYLTGKLDGQAKNARWASGICQIQASEIYKLARRMASSRTMLSVSWSLTRQDHGEQTFWAAINLAAMLGQIGLPGGGIGFGYSATNSIGAQNTTIRGASLPQGVNPVAAYIPVARVSDLLLNPGEAFDYNGSRCEYPHTRLVYWAGGNPFHHHQDLNRMLLAWQQPDTIIVNEWCWNSNAKHADIVLPCTTTLERNDIAVSPRDPFVVSMSKVTDPPGEARNDYDIFSAIAGKMGVEHAFTEGRSESEWLDWLYESTRENARQDGIDMPDYTQLKEQGWFVPKLPTQPTVLLDSFRRDPQAHPLKTPSGRIELFSSAVASFGYPDCAGHPVWIEPLEWLGSANLQDQLHLVSNQPVTRLHSQLDHGNHSRESKIRGREPVALHPTEAAKRHLVAGDIVRLHNARGACLGGLVVDDNIMPGVVQMSTGAWYDPLEPGQPGSLCKHGNPNVLTPDKGTSRLAQGPIAHTCLVRIEKFDGEVPEVTAFDPPEIIHTSQPRTPV